MSYLKPNLCFVSNLSFDKFGRALILCHELEYCSISKDAAIARWKLVNPDTKLGFDDDYDSNRDSSQSKKRENCWKYIVQRTYAT